MSSSLGSLVGWHLLVTRPQAQADTWAAQLEVLGASVSKQPMMVIAPVEDAGAKQAITNKVLAFDEYQKVIFISQNAVRFGCEWLDQYWPQLPIGIEYFAIGKATAQALQQSYEGLFTEAASAAMNSEDLLTHPKLQALNGQKILIFRGVGGRDYLCEQLTSRGALVDYCELYQRLCPKGPQTLPLAFRHSSHRPAVAVHSGETLENLCSILATDDLLWLQQQVILVPGERVADLARQAGFKQIAIAQNASHHSMVTALNAMRTA